MSCNDYFYNDYKNNHLWALKPDFVKVAQTDRGRHEIEEGVAYSSKLILRIPRSV